MFDEKQRKKIACECVGVTYGMIEDAVNAGASSYEEIERKLEVGVCCGHCVEFLRFMVNDLIEQRDKRANA